ncbi:hypothetical protein D9M70_467100 [compost metagenome]
MVGQPAPPTEAEFISNIIVKCIDRHSHDQNVDALCDGNPEAISILCRQCRCKFPGLLVEQYICFGLPQQQQYQQDKQANCRPFVPGEPVRLRNGPESSPQVPIVSANAVLRRRTAVRSRIISDAHVTLPRTERVTYSLR